MAGHSQFKNIMYRKGAQDAKRAKMFTKIIREITVAVREGGVDPHANPRLRQGLIAARDANMPKDNVERAIKKASTEAGGAEYQSVRYEGYGPGGVAFVVEALTDNRNRTASDVRSVFTKAGGALGEEGSVSFQFRRLGLITYPGGHASFDQVFEWAASCEAEDVWPEDHTFVISVAPESLHTLRDRLMETMGEPLRMERVWNPLNEVPISDVGTAQSLMKLMNALEDLDDVQHVFMNAEIDPTTLQDLAAS